MSGRYAVAAGVLAAVALAAVLLWMPAGGASEQDPEPPGDTDMTKRPKPFKDITEVETHGGRSER